MSIRSYFVTLLFTPIKYLMENKRRKTEDSTPIPPSIFLTKPVPDLTSQVADFLKASILQAQNKIAHLKKCKEIGSISIEIEAKLGIITDKKYGGRLQLPIKSETVLDNRNGDFGFQSDMSMKQHAFYNSFLNSFVKPGSNLRYVHTKELDQFVKVPIGKVRQTIDLKTNTVKAKLLKTRVTDLHLYMPSSKLDCRISVNIESAGKTLLNSIGSTRFKVLGI